MNFKIICIPWDLPLGVYSLPTSCSFPGESENMKSTTEQLVINHQWSCPPDQLPSHLSLCLCPFVHQSAAFLFLHLPLSTSSYFLSCWLTFESQEFHQVPPESAQLLCHTMYGQGMWLSRSLHLQSCDCGGSFTTYHLVLVVVVVVSSSLSFFLGALLFYYYRGMVHR